MAAARCPNCCKNFPKKYVRCPICAEATDPGSNIKPDPDWRECVERARFAVPGRTVDVEEWRCLTLVAQGVSAETATLLASGDADIELVRRAVKNGCPEDRLRAIFA